MISMRSVLIGSNLLLALVAAGCQPHDHSDESSAGGHDEVAESWSVTAWGDRFEVFPEVDLLIAGETAVAHTHVTRLEDFTPLTEGRVEIVLAGSGGEQVFAADTPVRPGIYSIEIAPRSSGEFDLAFRIRDAGGAEQIGGGRVRVGSARDPGGILEAPSGEESSEGGEPLTFLKEQQWRSDFSTAWVGVGRLARSATGLARVRPPAGGENTLTAPVDGVVLPAAGGESWPFVGRRVSRATPLYRLVPLVAPDRSLPALEAELATLEAELESARNRHSRLEELLSLEAVSQREVEEARVRLQTLDARRAAAKRDLAAARAARQSGSAGEDLEIRAPFAGEVARVDVTPGSTVAAGEPLGRLVRTDVCWIEVLLSPGAARRLAVEGVRGVVLSAPELDVIRLEEGVRLISVAPEVVPQTGTVTALLEAPRIESLPLGTTLEAEVLTTDEREGIVIPASALVDDGGVPVVYVQLGGESFLRREIHLLERQGDRLLVEHLLPGERLVTRGGNAIRRSSLLAGGEIEGHVH